jgi:hypothetical protein
MPMVEIKGDKNVIEKIMLTSKGDELTISIKEGFWVENSRPKIYLQTPFLTKITTKGKQTGIGNVVVEGIDVNQFETEVLCGHIQLIGRANELNLRSSNQGYYKNQGIIDASQLRTKNIDARIQGSNSAIVFAIGKILVDLKHDASLSYIGSPETIQLKGKAVKIKDGFISVRDNSNMFNDQVEFSETELNFINVRIKNNSSRRRNFKIKGPNNSGRDFSYGFPMMPFSTWDKYVLVGTKIYLEQSGVNMKQLVTVSAKDEGQVIDLFSN